MTILHFLRGCLRLRGEKKKRHEEGKMGGQAWAVRTPSDEWVLVGRALPPRCVTGAFGVRFSCVK